MFCEFVPKFSPPKHRPTTHAQLAGWVYKMIRPTPDVDIETHRIDIPNRIAREPSSEVAGVVAVAVELQAALRIPLPASIQVRVADRTRLGRKRREILIEERHRAIRRVVVPFQYRPARVQHRRHIEIRILAVVVGSFVRMN
jgi:hypothetical protein